jgi:hypothetical protein
MRTVLGKAYGGNPPEPLSFEQFLEALERLR